MGEVSDSYVTKIDKLYFNIVNRNCLLDQTQVDKVFVDKASGKDTQRPELDSLLSFVRDGDIVVVHSMDRLALQG